MEWLVYDGREKGVSGSRATEREHDHDTYSPGTSTIAAGARMTCPSPQMRHPAGGATACPETQAAVKPTETR